MSLLIITSSGDATAEFVAKYLKIHSIPFQQLNTDLLLSHGISYSVGQALNPLVLEYEQEVINLSEVTSVWLRKPETPIPSEAIQDRQHRDGVIETGKLLLRNIYSLMPKAIWVNHPDRNAAAGRKMPQLEFAVKLGFNIPETIIGNKPQQVRQFIEGHPNGVIMKPLSIIFYDSGNPGEVYASYTTRVDDTILVNLDSLSLCPMIFQEEIRKLYEVRITFFGDAAFCAKIDSTRFAPDIVDWRIESNAGADWEVCEVPEPILDKCRQMLKAYGLHYGAFDFAVTPKGEYVFFELNPNGQWAWIEMETGMPMTTALVKALGFR